jgi:hypothetical protein
MVFLSMAYSFILESNNNKWRPKYVRDVKNFANKVNAARAEWRKAWNKPNLRRAIAKNFSKNYSAWLTKVKTINAQEKKQISNFYKEITEAKRSGNKAALNAVLAKYNVPKGSFGRASPPRTASPRRSASVARSPVPARSGKRRNTTNLRMNMARRNLAAAKNSLFRMKAELEAKRNNLERQISNIIYKIRELP